MYSAMESRARSFLHEKIAPSGTTVQQNYTNQPMSQTGINVPFDRSRPWVTREQFEIASSCRTQMSNLPRFMGELTARDAAPSQLDMNFVQSQESGPTNDQNIVQQDLLMQDTRLSHARRPRNGSRRGRGVVKGYAVSKRIRDNEDGKLSLSFSKRLGGAIGVNRRAFVDEVGVQVRQHVPVVGIEKWSQVSGTPKQIIKKKILDKFILEDNKENEMKIMKVANERYRTWRSALAATYRSYKTDEERLRNLPEELKIDQWKELMLYFGSDKFKNVSRVNSENRKKQKIKHICGSKSFSQISFEERDEDTGEEPNELQLWYKTHTKGEGEWTSEAAKEIHDNVSREIAEKENELGSSLTSENVDKVFQSVVGTKSGYVPGRGYMAKVSKAVMIEELQSQVNVQVTENRILNERVEELEKALDTERVLSAQRLEEAKQSMRDELLFMLTQFSSQKTSNGYGGGFFESLMNSGREVLEAASFNN